MFEIHPVKKVSVVIPVYNEQESLPELIRRTTTACESLGKEYEILLIDDGSSDNSAHMLVEASQAENSHIVSILLNRNYGQHSAIMAGFSHVTGDLIITLDADLQNPPEEIPRLVAKADEGYDVVGTVRQNRQDSWFRKTASKMIKRWVTTVVCCAPIAVILSMRCCTAMNAAPLSRFWRISSPAVPLKFQYIMPSVSLVNPNTVLCA